MFKKIPVCFVAVLLVANLFFPCFSKAATSSLEANLLINADRFDKLITESNKNKEFVSSLLIDGKEYSVTVNTRGNSSFYDGLNTKARRLPLEINFDSPVSFASFSNISSLKLNNSMTLYRLLAEYTALCIYRHMSVPVSESVPVFLSINGVDYGLYLGVEDVNDDFLYSRFGSDAIKNGNLYKSLDGETEPDDQKCFSTSYFGTLYRKEGNGNDTVLKAFLSAVESGKDFEKYLNVDEVIRFFACTAATGGTDTLLSSTHNVYLYEHNEKISFIPWDLSFAFDCFDDRQSINPDYKNFTTNGFFNLLMENSSNKEKYRSYIEEIRKTFLSPDISFGFAKNLLSHLMPYYERDCSMPLDKRVTAEYITSGNVLVDGNILFTLNEMYRQLEEQLNGTSDYFYVPDSAVSRISDLFPDTDIYSSGSSEVLEKIRSEYAKQRLRKDGSSVLVPGFIFVVLLSVVFLSYRLPKGKRK